MQRFPSRTALLMSPLLLACATAANAQMNYAGNLGGLSVGASFNFLLRAEGTARTTGLENPFNQGGNPFNDQTIERRAFLPPNVTQTQLDNLGIPIQVPQIGTWNTVPLVLFDDEVRRGDQIPSTDNESNFTALRGETETNVRFGDNWRFVMRTRTLFHPSVAMDEFDGRDVPGGIAGGDPKLLQGLPNYFDYRVEDGRGGQTSGNPMEFTGRKYFSDFPALLMEFSNGPLTVRVGNQQIAWGQAIFFRVLDVPNGLDLRRHSILDRAFEEFSDKRVPMLSARVTYQLTRNVIADAYAGRFQPTVFGNPNTGFNIIPSQFTVRDTYRTGGFNEKISYGLRLKGDYGNWGWQAIAVRRWNPDGTFHWTESQTEKGLPNQGLGGVVNALFALNPQGECGANTAEAFAQTAFEVSPSGVVSADEWFNFAARARLAGIEGLNASINDFPCAQALNASPIDTSDPDAQQQAVNQLNTFFIASGGLRGHIERRYHQENVFGLGLSYVTTSGIDLLDQIVFNLEASYQPNRKFTPIDLGQQPIEENETTVALVVEKWHRWTTRLPATFWVFQAMFKNRSDLFGRHLSGFGATQDNGIPPGVDDAYYLVLAALQPFANRVFEIEFASLYDVRGGIFLQPNLRWNAGHNIFVEGFYNYINGKVGSNPNRNILSTVDFAEEFTLRLTYQF